MKFVLITGVSSGIGLATSERLLARGYRVLGSVRNEVDAKWVQEKMGPAMTPVLFDVRDPDAVEQAAKNVREMVGEEGLTALINNAGTVIAGPLLHLSLASLREQFETNLFGLLRVTQAFIPLLGVEAQYRPGRLVNISSVSGRLAYPFLGAYSASKHALEALSDTLRRELAIYGIEVVVIEPGTVETSMIEKFRKQLDPFLATAYKHALEMVMRQIDRRKETAIGADQIAAVIEQALEATNPRPRYVVPRSRWLGWYLPRYLPDRWMDQIVCTKLGLRRP